MENVTVSDFATEPRREVRTEGCKRISKMNDVSDYDLGNCLDKQFDLISQAFKSGDEHKFEQAILRVVNVRRCKSNGALE